MFFLYSKWLALPLSTRHKLAAKYGVAKILPTHVQDNRVVQDGYRIEDVEAMLERETQHQTLDEVVASVDTPKPIVIDVQPEAVAPKPKAFCDYCDSKGVRHKKVCTRPQ